MADQSPHYDNLEVTNAFRKLNAPHEKQFTRQSRLGIYVSWASIFILIGLFALMASYLTVLDERAEQVRLQQTVNDVTQTLDNRLTQMAEVTQRASVRLMHLPHAQAPSNSAELTAQSLMQTYPEIYEVVLMDKDFKVLGEWHNPTQTNVTLFSNDIKTDTELSKLITRFMDGEETFLTPPYTVKDTPQVFVNMLIDTPISGQILLVRVSLSRVITEAGEIANAKNYVFYLTKDGLPILDEADSETTTGFNVLKASTNLGFFNTPGYQLVGLSFEHNIFDSSTYTKWAFSGLTLALVLISILLIRTQQAQWRNHQRLNAEYALRVAISDSTMTGLRVTDLSGRIQYVNETFVRLVGYSAEELIGQSMPYSYWDDTATAMTERLLAYPKEPIQQSVEIRVRRKNGTVIDAQINISPLLNERKQLIGWVGELYDITEQKRARERMKAAHERFTRVVQSMNSAICVVGYEGTKPVSLFSNIPYDQYFGSSPDAALRLMELVEKVPSSLAHEGVFDTQSGLWFDVRVKRITWTDDSPTTMIIATDITHQRKLQIQLEAQVQRTEATQRLVTMGEMASSLAHELNQPLAAISNYACGANMKLSLGKLTESEAEEAFSKIEKQARRVAEIIKRIRGFAKRADPQLSPISPWLVIYETMELATIQATKLKATIFTDIPVQLPNILGNAVMLEQLLLNLLKNAMESAQATQRLTVTLRVHVDHDHLVFNVIDHGTGVDDENKSKLFDAFYSTKKEGMGMGLNICRSIVEMHQGRITVTDTPGGGATFTFNVPLAKDGVMNTVPTNVDFPNLENWPGRADNITALDTSLSAQEPELPSQLILPGQPRPSTEPESLTPHMKNSSLENEDMLPTTLNLGSSLSEDFPSTLAPKRDSQG